MQQGYSYTCLAIGGGGFFGRVTELRILLVSRACRNATIRVVMLQSLTDGSSEQVSRQIICLKIGTALPPPSGHTPRPLQP